jgi:hypothetical protein
MVELFRDPSGEVQLASSASAVTGDQTEMTSVYMSYSNTAQSKDEKTIAELNETIQSLCSQIEVSIHKSSVICIIVAATTQYYIQKEVGESLFGIYTPYS